MHGSSKPFNIQNALAIGKGKLLLDGPKSQLHSEIQANEMLKNQAIGKL
jgi:hypothetical protein